MFSLDFLSEHDVPTFSLIQALATVPEFRRLINAILYININRLDDSLGYLLKFPKLFDLNTKLLIMRKACIELHYDCLIQYTSTAPSPAPESIVGTLQKSTTDLFPILAPYTLYFTDAWSQAEYLYSLQHRAGGGGSDVYTPPTKVMLSRSSPWRDLVELAKKSEGSGGGGMY